MTPDAEVLLSWNIVAKRIEKLMKEDRYLLAEDKVKYAQYKQKQEEKALQQAKEELGTVADETEIRFRRDGDSVRGRYFTIGRICSSQ